MRPLILLLLFATGAAYHTMHWADPEEKIIAVQAVTAPRGTSTSSGPAPRRTPAKPRPAGGGTQ